MSESMGVVWGGVGMVGKSVPEVWGGAGRCGKFEAVEVIEESIQLARDMRKANARGEVLGLSEDELAFCEALETNDSAVQVLDDKEATRHRPCAGRNRAEQLRDPPDARENLRAKLRQLVRRILRKQGCPPDEQEKAMRKVLEQAEVLSAGSAVLHPVGWATGGTDRSITDPALGLLDLRPIFLSGLEAPD